MKAKLGIFLLVLCVVSFFIYNKRGAQKEENTEKLINGIVISAVDNKPISNVQIAIAGSNPSTMTNSEGKYLILTKPSKELIFKHSGYRSVTLVASEAKTVKMEVADSAFINKVNENLK